MNYVDIKLLLFILSSLFTIIVPVVIVLYLITNITMSIILSIIIFTIGMYTTIKILESA